MRSLTRCLPRKLAGSQDDFAGGEVHGAAVEIEEIATGPADDALGGVEPEGAIGDGRLREVTVTVEGQASGLSCGESALEGLHLHVVGGAEFFRGGDGVEGTFARAIDDERSGWVEAEGFDLVEEGGLIDAGILRTGDAGGGEYFCRENVDELRRMGQLELGLEFVDGHRVGNWSRNRCWSRLL